jgi:hypothetical protein
VFRYGADSSLFRIRSRLRTRFACCLLFEMCSGTAPHRTTKCAVMTVRHWAVIVLVFISLGCWESGRPNVDERLECHDSCAHASCHDWPRQVLLESIGEVLLHEILVGQGLGCYGVWSNLMQRSILRSLHPPAHGVLIVYASRPFFGYGCR